MLDRIRTYVRTHRKQVGGVIASAISFAALHLGLDVDATTAVGVSTVIVGAVVGAVPNDER